MTFEAKTFDQIFNAMRGRTPSPISDFEEGSVARTLYESFAFELALLYGQMQQVYLSAFVDTAKEFQLDQVVAVLGIKRGEPDFATGFVSFDRDLGGGTVVEIPIGFLVTTEDSEAFPKKAYKTIEARTLAYNTPNIEVRVQAVQPDEVGETQAQTILVMPQPLPGIKAITNKEPIRFTGKRRETDGELRHRAKAALLAASGANTTAIENALISLPNVTEVKVRENFHYARGTVGLERQAGESEVPDITISRKTPLISEDSKKRFLTRKTATIAQGTSVVVEVEAVVRGVAGEVAKNARWQSLEKSGIAIAVSNPEPIVLKDFGVIEVFVDGVNVEDPKQAELLKERIDEVKAAGIYVLLKSAQKIQVDGVFKIELKPGQQLSNPERTSLIQQLQERVTAQIAQQRMGQPLLLSQLTRTLLDHPAVNDLVTVELVPDPQRGDASARRLEADITEKFVPGKIKVEIVPTGGSV